MIIFKNRAQKVFKITWSPQIFIDFVILCFETGKGSMQCFGCCTGLSMYAGKYTNIHKSC